MHWIMLLWWPPIIILCPCQMTKSILFHESFLPSHSLVYPNSDLGKYWCITSKSYGGLLSPVCLYFVMFLQCHLFCFLLISQPGSICSYKSIFKLRLAYSIDSLINTKHRYMFTFGALEWFSQVSTYAKRVLPTLYFPPLRCSRSTSLCWNVAFSSFSR